MFVFFYGQGPFGNATSDWDAPAPAGFEFTPRHLGEVTAVLRARLAAARAALPVRMATPPERWPAAVQARPKPRDGLVINPLSSFNAFEVTAGRRLYSVTECYRVLPYPLLITSFLPFLLPFHCGGKVSFDGHAPSDFLMHPWRRFSGPATGSLEQRVYILLPAADGVNALYTHVGLPDCFVAAK